MDNKIAGIDPGFSGGISIISDNEILVYPMPIIKTTKKIKNKNKTSHSYDLLEIRKIFINNLDENDTILIERVSSRPGEGSTSSFHFGEGYGSIKGLIVGLFNKSPIEISPQTWKKHFPELRNSSIFTLKKDIEEIREKNITIKDKDKKNQINKNIEKINRQIKKIAKSLARELVSERYPDLAYLFKKANSDGMAESLLIALYGKEKLT